MSGPVDWAKSSGEQDQGGYATSQPYPSQPYPSQPYPSQSYPSSGYDQGSAGNPAIPPTNAGWAVAAVIFFWPLAFTAFTASSNVVRLWAMGDYAGAQRASEQARKMGRIALGLFVGFFVLYIVFIFLLVFVSASSFS